jgi:type IV secretion system protein VirB2
MTQHPLATPAPRAGALHRSARQILPLLLLAFAVVTLMPTDHVFASAASGGGLPYETWLGTLRNSVTGPVAFTVAIVALVGTGSALIFQGGEMNTFLRSVIYFILVIALVIGAQNIMSGLFGKGAVVAQHHELREAPAAIALFHARSLSQASPGSWGS